MYTIEEGHEEEEARRLPPKEDEETLIAPELSDPGVGFIGGPTWHYPEEEIQFRSGDEDEREEYYDCDCEFDCDCDCEFDYEYEYGKGRHQLPGESIDNNSLDVENRRDIWDWFSFGAMSKTKTESEPDGSCHEYGTSHTDISQSCNYSNSNSSNNSKGRRRQRRRENGSKDGSKSKSKSEVRDQQYRRFREAALCLPFEYTSSLATMCVRRPYGIASSKIFRVIAPDTSDQQYTQRARALSSHTIQVAITIAADNSMMLLYDKAGVRYKNDSSDTEWTDVRDVGDLEVPLGDVSTAECKYPYSYSLDQVLKEAILVREQYCSTLVSTALDSGTTATGASPPSLEKSAGSTPPRSRCYYDGSNSLSGSGSIHNNSSYQDNDEEEGITRKRLDFWQCLTPSVMSTTKSIETYPSRVSQWSLKSHQKLKRKRRRKLYRFCQKVFIVIGFYCSGIFLVASLSGIDNERLDSIVAILFPSSFQARISNNNGDSNGNGNHITQLWWFLDTTAEEQPQRQEKVEGTNGSLESMDFPPIDGSGSVDDNNLGTSKRVLEIDNIFVERIERECRIAVEVATNESHNYKEQLERVETSLEEESRQKEALSKQYHSEQEHSKALLREKEEAITLVQHFRRQAESVAIELELGQEQVQIQQRKREERIAELEKEIALLTEREKVHNETAKTFSCRSQTIDTTADKGDKPQRPMDEAKVNQKIIQKDITTELLNTDENNYPNNNAAVDKDDKRHHPMDEGKVHRETRQTEIQTEVLDTDENNSPAINIAAHKHEKLQRRMEVGKIDKETKQEESQTELSDAVENNDPTIIVAAHNDEKSQRRMDVGKVGKKIGQEESQTELFDAVENNNPIINVAVYQDEKLHINEGKVNQKTRWRESQAQLLNTVENKNTTKTLSKNQSLLDEEDTEARKEIQSVQNVLLKSALADKGPLWPKLHRQLTKGLHFGIVDEMHAFTGTRGDKLSTRNDKIEVFARSVKEAVRENVKKIVGTRRKQDGNESGDKMDKPGKDHLALTRESLTNIGNAAKKETRSILRATIHSTESFMEKIATPKQAGQEAKSILRATIHSTENFMEKIAAPMQARKEAKSMLRATVDSTENVIGKSKQFSDLREKWKHKASNAFDAVVQSVLPKSVENPKVIKEKFLKHGKEGSKVVRQQVTKNVEKASTTGMNKLDHGKEAMTALGDFARTKLDFVGKRVFKFATEKWERRRLQGLQQGLRVPASNHYYQGFVGNRKFGFDVEII